MNQTIKFIISFAFIFMYSFFGFLWWSSPSSNHDQKAWHFFENSNYNMTIGFVTELEKQSNAAKYPLYLGYAFREKGDLDQSTAYFKKALRQEKSGHNPRLSLEIYLNLCLNGYVKKDPVLFKESLIAAKEIKNHYNSLQKNENYTHLFKAIDELLEKNYEEALILFQKEQIYTALSPWMKSSFEKRFSKTWIKKHLIYCLIQESKFILADQQLNELEKEETDDFHFLKAYMLFNLKMAIQDDKLRQTFELESFNINDVSRVRDCSEAIAETNLQLQKIKNRKAVFIEFEQIFQNLESDLLLMSTNGLLKNFSNHLSFLQNSLPTDAFDALLLKLFNQIEEPLTANSSQKVFALLQHLPKEIHAKLFDKILNQIDILLKEKKFEILENYVDFIPKSFFEKIETLTFTGLNPNHEMESVTACINLWCSLETSSAARLNFAKKTLLLAENLWMNEQNYTQAVELFKKALTIPNIDDQPIVTKNLENTFFRLHKRALDEDRIVENFHILNALKALKLNYINLYDHQEKMKLIEDASYFFARHLYEKAYERASFLLMLEPENLSANRLLGLIFYEKGDFDQASKTLQKIQNPDSTVLKALEYLKLRL